MERKDRIKELRQRLVNLNNAERKTLQDKGIIATVEGRPLSLHNTLLLYLQITRRTPSIVGGYRQWRKAGRQVNKGEHGAVIFFRVGDKDDDGEIIEAQAFYTAVVFDITQTSKIEGENKASEGEGVPAGPAGSEAIPALAGATPV